MWASIDAMIHVVLFVMPSFFPHDLTWGETAPFIFAVVFNVCLMVAMRVGKPFFIILWQVFDLL